jgi:hypothetical protein
MAAFDPYVWTDRASQEGIWDGQTVLHQCIRPLSGARLAPGQYGYQRAFALISGKASTGQMGHQISNAPADGCSIPFSISQTLVGSLPCWSISRIASLDASATALIEPLTSQNAPSDAGKFVGQGDSQDISM